MEGVGVAEHPRLDTVSPESKEPGRGWRRAQAGQAIRRKADSGVWGGEVVGKGGVLLWQKTPAWQAASIRDDEAGSSRTRSREGGVMEWGGRGLGARARRTNAGPQAGA